MAKNDHRYDSMKYFGDGGDTSNHCNDGTSTVSSVLLAIAPDGTCPRHPNVVLRETDADGYKYQMESCPACDDDFKNQRYLLKQKKDEVDRQLGQLDEGDDIEDNYDSWEQHGDTEGDEKPIVQVTANTDDDLDVSNNRGFSVDDEDVYQETTLPPAPAPSPHVGDGVEHDSYVSTPIEGDTTKKKSHRHRSHRHHHHSEHHDDAVGDEMPMVQEITNTDAEAGNPMDVLQKETVLSGSPAPSSEIANSKVVHKARRSRTDDEVELASAVHSYHRHREYGYRPPAYETNHHHMPGGITLKLLADQYNMMQQMQDRMIHDKDVELTNLRFKVDDLQHQLLFTQIEMAVMKEKMEYSERFVKQEIVLAKLDASAAARDHRRRHENDTVAATTNKTADKNRPVSSKSNNDKAKRKKKSKKVHIEEPQVQVGSNVADADPPVIEAATLAVSAAGVESVLEDQQEGGREEQEGEQREMMAVAPMPIPTPTKTATMAMQPHATMAIQRTPQPLSPVPSAGTASSGSVSSDSASPSIPNSPPPDVAKPKEAEPARANLVPLAAAAATAAAIGINAQSTPAPQEIAYHPTSMTTEAENDGSEDTIDEDDHFDENFSPWSTPGVKAAPRVFGRKDAMAPVAERSGPLNSDNNEAVDAQPEEQPEGPTIAAMAAAYRPPERGVPSQVGYRDSFSVPSNEDLTIASQSDRSLLNSRPSAASQLTPTPNELMLQQVVADQQLSSPPTPIANKRSTMDSYTSDGESSTVSSTYGDDRRKVVGLGLTDPYGDRGAYTGVVLRSTGMPHGVGRMVYDDDGRTFEGDWRHGRWHGYGRATFPNTDWYEGEYRFDQRHGRGKYSWNDGRSYDGDFVEDKRHGKGTLEWPDGAKYTGDFNMGEREGQGKYLFSDGGYYVGGWVDGRYEGYGECHWEDGRTYKGEWRNGMAHGYGVETNPDGTLRHDGQWIEDVPVQE